MDAEYKRALRRQAIQQRKATPPTAASPATPTGIPLAAPTAAPLAKKRKGLMCFAVSSQKVHRRQSLRSSCHVAN